MPSVASVGENRQDMLVKGGGPTENGFIIDNIYIPSISHFNTPDGRSNGPIGLINTEMVDDIEFFSNGFPAEYGNKLSSYGNIRYRNGKKDSLAANISLGMGGAGGLVEGPLTEDVSFIGSYRRSYLDIISEAINAGGGLPSYGDLQGKLKYNPSHFSAYTILFINGNSLYKRGKKQNPYLLVKTHTVVSKIIKTPLDLLTDTYGTRIFIRIHLYRCHTKMQKQLFMKINQIQ